MLQWFNWWDVGLLFLFLISLMLVHGYWTVGGFKRKGVKCLPAYPIVGNTGSALMKKIHFVDTTLECYLAFPNEKYMGVYQFQKPNLLLLDVELIKQIGIKDFENFHDHQKIFNDSEDLFSKTLLVLTGQKWHDMRATLSPAFTSSKMRNMFIFIDECAENMGNFYLKKMKEDVNLKNGYVEIEMKDTFTRFANDVIATSAFGIKIDSLTDENNEFYAMGKQATNFGAFQIFKSFMFLIVPKIMKLLEIKIFDERVAGFFRNLVNNQMKYREENNVIRPDMIHLLMEAKKGTLVHDTDNEVSQQGFATVEESTIGKKTVIKKWDDDEIIAQALLFFFAGFDTSSTVLTLMSHELTLNGDIQKKIQQEIDQVLENTKGKPSYNDIQNMKYMDMVVSETLRKWPPGPITDRVCLKPYTLPPSSPGAKPYTINPGDVVWIPIYAIHRDPKYFPNPGKFDPERFSDENKANIKPFTYMPFGIGPRNCIGSRFALLEMKLVIFHLLKKFDFVPTSKTTNPLVLDKKVFNVAAEGKTWLGLKPRSK